MVTIIVAGNTASDRALVFRDVVALGCKAHGCCVGAGRASASLDARFRRFFFFGIGAFRAFASALRFFAVAFAFAFSTFAFVFAAFTLALASARAILRATLSAFFAASTLWLRLYTSSPDEVKSLTWTTLRNCACNGRRALDRSTSAPPRRVTAKAQHVNSEGLMLIAMHARARL